MQIRIKKVNVPCVVTYFVSLVTDNPMACTHCGGVSTSMEIALAIRFSFSWLQLMCYRAISTLDCRILRLSVCINALQGYRLTAPVTLRFQHNPSSAIRSKLSRIRCLCNITRNSVFLVIERKILCFSDVTRCSLDVLSL